MIRIELNGSLAIIELPFRFKIPMSAAGQKRKLDLLNSSHRQWLLQHWKQPFEQLLRSIFDF